MYALVPFASDAAVIDGRGRHQTDGLVRLLGWPFAKIACVPHHTEHGHPKTKKSRDRCRKPFAKYRMMSAHYFEAVKIVPRGRGEFSAFVAQKDLSYY